MDRLELTYGSVQTAAMTQQEFEDASQKKEETLREWADRVQRLGCHAFKSLPVEYEQSRIVIKFCEGLITKRMAYDITMHQPKTLQEALRLAVMSETTFRNYVKKDKPNTPKVRYTTPDYDDEKWSYFESDYDFESESEDEYAIQQVSKPAPTYRRNGNTARNTQQRRPPRSGVPRNNPPRKKTEREIFIDIMNSIQQGLSHLQVSESNQNASQSAMSANNMRSSGTQTGMACYKCNDPNHFIKDCPKNNAGLNQ
ncbi:MAG: zinc finger CCHC domain-containing protein [Desulfobacterales bacterium]